MGMVNSSYPMGYGGSGGGSYSGGGGSYSGGGGSGAPWGIFGRFAGGVVEGRMAASASRKSRNFIRRAEIPEIKRRSQYEQWRMNEAGQRVMGEQRNKLAATGVETTENTAIDVLAETIKQMTLDQLVVQRDTKWDVAMKREEIEQMKRESKKSQMSSALGIFS